MPAKFECVVTREQLHTSIRAVCVCVCVCAGRGAPARLRTYLAPLTSAKITVWFLQRSTLVCCFTIIKFVFLMKTTHNPQDPAAFIHVLCKMLTRLTSCLE